MIKHKIKQVMSSVFDINIKDIPDTASQKNLEVWDSLQHLNLAVELEEAFNMEFTPEEISEMTSIDKIVEIVERTKK